MHSSIQNEEKTNEENMRPPDLDHIQVHSNSIRLDFDETTDEVFMIKMSKEIEITIIFLQTHKKNDIRKIILLN